MNLRDNLNNYRAQLSAICDEEEISSTFYIVSESVLGYTRSQLIFRLDEQVKMEDQARYQSILERLQQQEPLQYILEEAHFYGLRFKVGPSVLIPRPETEELVALVLKEVAEFAAPLAQPSILDIGTGSGCIAITLKKHLPAAVVSALDVSKSALQIAEENAVRNQVSINLIEADIRTYQHKGKFDIIVSNPPYITEHEGDAMHQNVLAFEPHLALFVSNHNPLEFYEAIADFAAVALSTNGMLFFEINANFGHETAEMLKSRSFSDVQVLKDMHGKNRFVTAALM